MAKRAARKLNLSETVFVVSAGDDAGCDAHIRIFTPALELPFAGHPVLGAAFVLGERLARPGRRAPRGPARAWYRCR